MGREGRSRGSFVKWLLMIVVVVVVLAPVVGYLAVPGIHDQIDSLLGQGGQQVILLRHPSSNALDKDITTYWLADPANGDDTVTVNFSETTNLAGLIFHVGATGADYQTYGRPSQVQLVFPGEPKPVSILLNDDPAPQQRCLKKPESVRTFDIKIVGSNPGQSPDQDLVALREVEFIAGSCP